MYALNIVRSLIIFQKRLLNVSEAEVGLVDKRDGLSGKT